MITPSTVSVYPLEKNMKSLTQRHRGTGKKPRNSFAVLSFSSVALCEIRILVAHWTKKSGKMILDTPPRARVP
jgi:hypothetical protein